MDSRTVAVDAGNWGIKMVGENGRLFVPNVIARESEKRQTIQMEDDPLKGLHFRIESKAVKSNGVYVAGDLALKYAARQEIETGSDKYNNDQSIIMLLLVHAIDAMQNVWDGKSETVEAYYRTSTGLPLQEILKEKNVPFRNNLEKYTHEIKFLDVKNWGGVTVKLNLEEVITSSEGHSAVFDVSVNDEGEIVDPEIFSSNVAFVDIGAVTTDVAVIEEGGQVDNTNSKGWLIGCAEYLDQIISETQRIHKARIKGRLELTKIIKSGQFKVKKHGNTIPIGDIVDKHLETMAQRIYENINMLWNDVPDLDYVWLIGGGAALLHPYMDSVNQKDLPIKYTENPDDSLWVVVNGYYKFAKLKQAE